MTKSITPKQIKANNRQQIYNYIYESGKVSQQDIAYALRLSRPTVAANLAALETDGLIFKNGQQDSELIGRKAVGYSIVRDYRVAIGVEVRRRKVILIAVNLYGRPAGNSADCLTLNIPYKNEARYYKKVASEIESFISAQGFRPEQLLGIGFAMQGLVSSDGKKVLYGAILENSGLTIEAFSRHLPYPCTFIHDPESAALTELWHSPDLANAIYISLSHHLGGAMITNGLVRAGKHGHNATFEHIQVRMDGDLCYCGKRGCLETLCSLNALLGDDPPEPFFEAVRNGSPEETKRWKAYLDNLAMMLNMLHLVRDVDIVLGGHLAAFLAEEDIQYLYDRIRDLTPFGDPDDFLVLSKMPKNNITIGGALLYIRAFLEDIDMEGEPVIEM